MNKHGINQPRSCCQRNILINMTALFARATRETALQASIGCICYSTVGIQHQPHQGHLSHSKYLDWHEQKWNQATGHHRFNSITCDDHGSKRDLFDINQYWRLVSGLAGFPASWLAGFMASWLAGSLGGLLAGLLACWLTGYVTGWMAEWRG